MTDKITIDRAVAAEMLEFLVNGNFVYPTKFYKALRAALDKPALAQQPAVPPDMRLVPESTLRWLFGEEGEFECPPEKYFKGRPAPYWWRGVLREKLNAAPEVPAAQSDRDAQEEPFEEWWEKHGQFCRAGGGDYEKTFAWNAWCAAAQKEQP